MPFSFLAKFIVLLVLGLAVTFVIDPLDPTTISTPFLLGIILMWLSLHQSPYLVATVSLLYSVMAVYALLRGHQYFMTHVYATPHPYFWLFQRMGVFLLLCGLSTYLARYRTDTQRITSNIQNILSKLPAPVVISDAAGYIVYANEALGAVFKQSTAALAGKRYVDFFMTDIQEGKAMRYYIELFGEETDAIHELEIKPFDSEDKIKARLTCLGSGTNRVMVSVFNVTAPKS